MAPSRRRRHSPVPQRLILDSGAVLAIARRDARARAALEAAREAGATISVPAPVVAETVRGTARDAPVDRVIKAVGAVDVIDEARGRGAGALLRAARSDSTVDAMVVAVGLGVPCVILTGDPDDLRALADGHPEVTVHAV